MLETSLVQDHAKVTSTAGNSLQFDAVPDGYELDFNSTTPIWFGPEFENQSFAAWDFEGFRLNIIADEGRYHECVTVDQAKEILRISAEVNRQAAGILAIMGELPATEDS